MSAKKSEIPLKTWLYDEAQRLGISPVGVHHRLQRGHYPKLKLRRVNPRVIFVKV
jgi:hypothetical protein